jgi:FKBP-type peptidyl-prolyl cis-trans isomerase SlyD
VQPEEGYGAHDPAGVIEVPRASLSPDVELDLGVMVETQGPHGRIELTVVAFDEETVCLDCNHPLAGHVLHFTGTIGVIRDAHPDEIKHHRVHPAGHHLMVSDSSFDESLLSP